MLSMLGDLLFCLEHATTESLAFSRLVSNKTEFLQLELKDLPHIKSHYQTFRLINDIALRPTVFIYSHKLGNKGHWTFTNLYF